MSAPEHGRISRREPLAWAGIAAVTAGVLLHLPMYVQGADDDYMLAGMAIDAPMIVGMVLILVGLAATAYGLFPKALPTPASALLEPLTRRRKRAGQVGSYD